MTNKEASITKILEAVETAMSVAKAMKNDDHPEMDHETMDMTYGVNVVLRVRGFSPVTRDLIEAACDVDAAQYGLGTGKPQSDI